MARILAIDYGRRRCGIAVTDILNISANGLPTVATAELEQFLTDYISREQVSEIVVGYPRQTNGEDSESMRYIRPFLKKLSSLASGIKITLYDERFTSSIAHKAMLMGGVPKMARRQKELADRTAAVIILTDYLNSRRFA